MADAAAAAPAAHDATRVREPVVYVIEPPRGRSYVGFTTHLARRLRQHNGAIKGGARRTARARGTWALRFFIRGFESKKEALRFEWALQHPARSLAMRAFAARGFSSSARLATARAAVAGVDRWRGLEVVIP